ncbi:hypothetical protein [Bacillus thuringiensis]
MKTGWVKTGGFIMDDNGQLEMHQPDAYYYFSSNGPMVTGWFTDADGRTYYLNPEETQKFYKGQMAEGFVEIGKGKWFYFNPLDISRLAPNGYDNLPEAGKKLLKDTFGISKNILRGEQRTEWIHDNGAWYYCSPEKNNRFDKGQMVTGEVNIKNSEGNIKTYQFNNDGACTNTYQKMVLQYFMVVVPFFIAYQLFYTNEYLNLEIIFCPSKLFKTFFNLGELTYYFKRRSSLYLSNFCYPTITRILILLYIITLLKFYNYL